MKRKERIGLALAAGGGAAAIYGGYATMAWLRYGHAQAKEIETALDRYMPLPEVIEHQKIEVNAPAEAAYDACRNLDLTRSAFVRAIFATRARVMRVPATEPQYSSAALIDVAQSLGWRVLEETPGSEIVLAAVCKPWHGDPQFTGLAPDEFTKFDEPGFAKIVWNFRIDPVTESRCVVHTETRVTTTDADSRRRFRRYWSFVSAGIVLIRLFGLRIAKADAEKSVVRCECVL